MIMIRHELRQNRVSFWAWTLSIGFLIAVCIVIFPEMKGQMDGIGEIFASLGSFSEAFGMDKISFGTFLGFYSVECGNILGIGGAFFAALCGISALAKEEKQHTAEFLFTHPVGRTRVITQKLLAILIQILAMNLLVFALAVGAVALTGEPIPLREMALLHMANLLLQIEVAGICFGVSAFLRRGELSIGMGIAILLYFLGIVANLSEGAAFLRVITPFGYTEGADILANGSLDGGLILCGMAYTVVGILTAYRKYTGKDLS